MEVVKKIILFFSIVNVGFAQFSAGSFSNVEPRNIIDLPTAGVLKIKNYALDFGFFEQGGVIMKLEAGALENLNLGISFSGKEIIGGRKIIFQKYPAIAIKYRLLDEKKSYPAIVLGFDSQGKGEWIDSTKRFAIKSRGVFLAGSRNYSYYGNLSMHFGANYSFEKSDNDISPNIFFGLEKSIGEYNSFLMEYDFALNDDDVKSIGTNKGYLNLGFRSSLGNGFTIGMDFKDLFLNRKDIYSSNRNFQMEFISNF